MPLWLLANGRLIAAGIALFAVGGTFAYYVGAYKGAQASLALAEVRLEAAQRNVDQLAANAANVAETMGREARAAENATANLRKLNAETAVRATQLSDVLRKEESADAKFAACMAMPLPRSLLDQLP
jgi:hypothetical protein